MIIRKAMTTIHPHSSNSNRIKRRDGRRTIRNNVSVGLKSMSKLLSRRLVTHYEVSHDPKQRIVP